MPFSISHALATNFGSMGACETVVNALHIFGTENVQVAEFACSTITKLALGGVDNQAKLFKTDACEALIKTLKYFGTGKRINDCSSVCCSISCFGQCGHLCQVGQLKRV